MCSPGSGQLFVFINILRRSYTALFFFYLITKQYSLIRSSKYYVKGSREHIVAFPEMAECLEGANFLSPEIKGPAIFYLHYRADAMMNSVS